MFLRRFLNVWRMSNESFVKDLKCFSSPGHSDLVQRHHDSKSPRREVSYENAIKMLNTLQLDVPTLEELYKKDLIRDRQSRNFKKAERFAAIAKVLVEEIDKLAAIHVSGTKGKGSVCAFCESILRRSGYKTGFYSSPHLIEVRERLRINGKPISKELFTDYFWECWNNYDQKTEKPSYGTFLTFMSFYVFLKEKVDVAIVEVGMGGEYDATNVIRKPVVCGVTQLERDHLQALGGSIASIAWHKAGIFKSGVPAFTASQEPAAMDVLAQRAWERKTPLKVVPDMSTFLQGKDVAALGIEGKHQYQNASLAVHMCHSWLEHRERSGNHEESSLENVSDFSEQSSSPPIADVFSIPDSFKEGLSRTYWPGRTQCVERTNLTFYLDGAHTRNSIEACASWFCDKSNEEITRKRPKRISRVLIFNFKGNRDAKTLMEPLVECNFDYVVFCPNLLSEEPLARTSDISNFSRTPESQKQKCYEIQETWQEIIRARHLSAAAMPKIQTSEQNSRVFACVSDAVRWVVNDREASITSRKYTLPDVISRADHVQVFVTGSLYLVGMVMKVLGPEIVEI